jgi:hypothetical protein
MGTPSKIQGAELLSPHGARLVSARQERYKPEAMVGCSTVGFEVPVSFRRRMRSWPSTTQSHFRSEWVATGWLMALVDVGRFLSRSVLIRRGRTAALSRASSAWPSRGAATGTFYQGRKTALPLMLGVVAVRLCRLTVVRGAAHPDQPRRVARPFQVAGRPRPFIQPRSATVRREDHDAIEVATAPISMMAGALLACGQANRTHPSKPDLRDRADQARRRVQHPVPPVGTAAQNPPRALPLGAWRRP